MAITKMNKFTLVCFRKDKKSVLKNLQSFGNTQLINLQTETNTENSLDFFNVETVEDEIKAIDMNIATLRASVNFLSEYTQKVSSFKSLRDGKEEISYDKLKDIVHNSSWDDICRELKSKEVRISEINTEINRINNEMDALIPWIDLDTSFGSLFRVKDVVNYVGVIKIKSNDEFNEFKNNVDSLNLCGVYEINRVSMDVYVVLMVHKSQVSEFTDVLKTVEFTEYKSDCINNVKDEIDELKSMETSLQAELLEIHSALEKDNRLSILEKCEEYFSNKRDRLDASKNFRGSKNTVVISGWVPSDLNNNLREKIETATSSDVYLVFEDVKDEEEQSVPIKLKNNGLVSPFESITEMYSLPNYKGLDPTPWLAPFYLIFFGMMVADFGYGIVVILAALGALKLFKLEESSRKFTKLFLYLGISTTAWGLIYGAGFGDMITFDSLLNQNNDIFTIMYMSVGFGVIQILMGLLIKATMLIKTKQYFKAFGEVGLWLITFAGIALMACGVSLGTWIMVGGMVGIVLTNGGEAQSIGGKIGNGAYALYGITNYVGDLISYTRLMALGIAGGSIAGAINIILNSLPDVASFITIPLMFLLLHVFNLLLGLLGAYVHSCRLQFVEYFGKFYEGSGVAFEPLKMRNKNIDVK